MSVIEKIRLVGQKAKDNACWYLEAMGEDINLVFHARVIIEDIVVEIAKLIGIPF